MTASNLEALRRWARLFDSAFQVPGTRFRFGLDPLIGLLPGINAIVDGVVGSVPIVGDAFDFLWHANEWNMALLERHATAVQPATSGDWLFVMLCVTAIVLAAVIPLLLAAAFFYWAGRELRGIGLV